MDSYSIFSALFAIPGVLIELGAIGYAIAKWKQHPTVSMLVVVSSGIHLMIRAAYTVLPMMMSRIGGISDTRTVYIAMNAVTSLLGAVASVMVIIAIFSGRSTGTEAPVQRW